MAGRAPDARIVAAGPVPRRRAVRVPTTGGFSLVLERFAPRGEARGVLLLGPAMMANRRSLDRPRGRGLASFLAGRGFVAYTLDLRGHGESRPGASPWVDWSYDDIVREDLPRAIRAAAAAEPGLPLALVGHSLCGHGGAACLGRDPDLPVRALVMLGAAVWIPRLAPGRARAAAWRATVAAWVAATRAAGYFPARRLGLGTDDEPRSYVAQFLDWQRADAWRSRDGRDDYLAGLGRVRIPVLAVTSRRDPIAPPPVARALAAHLAAARVTHLEAGTPGHMPIATDPASRPAWERIAAWLEAALAGG